MRSRAVRLAASQSTTIGNIASLSWLDSFNATSPSRCAGDQNATAGAPMSAPITSTSVE